MVGKWGLVSNDFSPNPALSFYILKAVRCADCGVPPSLVPLGVASPSKLGRAVGLLMP